MDKNSKFLLQKQAKQLPIGIFDSGIGGLTVLSEVTKVLPAESIAYLGDTARLPYGNKGKETILRFSQENSTYLTNLGIKALVIACNTSAAIALKPLQEAMDMPVIGVIDPGVAKAVARTKTGHIAVLGTKGTIASGAYQSAILSAMPEACVHAIACPLFVPLVEENFIDHVTTEMIIREYLQPLKNTSVDTLILGCTHYPLLRQKIQQVVGEHVDIVDSAVACAEALRTILTNADLLDYKTTPEYAFHVSDDPEQFRRIGYSIIGEMLGDVKLMCCPSLISL